MKVEIDNLSFRSGSVYVYHRETELDDDESVLFQGTTSVNVWLCGRHSNDESEPGSHPDASKTEMRADLTADVTGGVDLLRSTGTVRLEFKIPNEFHHHDGYTTGAAEPIDASVTVTVEQVAELVKLLEPYATPEALEKTLASYS